MDYLIGALAGIVFCSALLIVFAWLSDRAAQRRPEELDRMWEHHAKVEERLAGYVFHTERVADALDELVEIARRTPQDQGLCTGALDLRGVEW